MKLIKRFRRAACCCLVIPAFAAGAAFFWIGHLLRPVSTSHKAVTVNIKPGSDARTIARTLESKHLIRSEAMFLWVAYRRDALHRMKSGRYRLAQDLGPAEIVERLKKGPDDERTVVIPEGFTLSQISERMKSRGVIKDRDEFVRILRNRKPEVTAPFPLPSNGLEGYLFPDTYLFAPNTKPQKVAQTMLDNFTRQIYDKHRAEIKGNRYSLHEIVTIASLIEREAEVPQDRAKIAGVIGNRLRKHMLLQIDATVLYALGRHKSRVLYKDLEVRSPYNTYVHKGLPPGPIASPGEASIVAALSPERHNYLYYVASSDGSHIFTRTEAEHNAAKARVNAQAARRNATLGQ